MTATITTTNGHVEVDYMAMAEAAIITPEMLQAEQEQQAEAGPADRSIYRYTDAAFAETFIEANDNYRYTDPVGWRRWNGRNWERDKASSELWQDVKKHLVAVSREVLGTDPENVKYCLPRRQTIANVIAHLQHMLMSMEADFQPKEHLINCRNGIIDLKTGSVSKHDKAAGFDWCVDATYTKGKYNRELVDLVTSMFPTVAGTFSTGADGRAEYEQSDVAKYLHKCLGYSITGETREELCFYIFGKTRSGKGTLLNTIAEVLGKRVTGALSFDALENSRSDPQNFRLAGLSNTRYLVVSESADGTRLNEQLIKTITGRDQITASFKGKDSFSYTPSFKVWMMSNFAINGKFDDDAFWARFKLFTVTGESHFGNEDVEKKDRLLSKSGRDGILSWLIDGAIRYYREGLRDTPDCMKTDLQRQRTDRDVISSWFEESVTPDPEATTPLDNIYADYAQWCDDNGVIHKKAKNGLSMILKNRGYTSERIQEDGKKTTLVKGLRVR